MPPQIAPYGSWKSPLKPDLIVADTIGLGSLWLDGETAYWLEARPAEGGRQVLVRWRNGETVEVNPAPFNMRTRVHEYGGGSFAVAGGAVFGSNFADQRVYAFGEGAPRALTPARDLRYADSEIDARRGLMFAVREDHTHAADPLGVNELVALKLDGSDTESGGRAVVAGNDFYASPRLSPDGRRLCWLTWNHPNMPWDGAELWLAEVNDDGSLQGARRLAGGPSESIFQPAWSPDGRLYFVSDRTGWWNLYRWNDDSHLAEPLCEREAEFGLPAWTFRMSTYAFASAEQIVCSYIASGEAHLALLDLTTGDLKELRTPYTEFSYVCAAPGLACFVAGSPTEPPVVARLHLVSGRLEVLKRSSSLRLDEGYLSRPRAVEFPTANHQTAHAYFYPPRNKDFAAPEGEKPPLIVVSHGGPTAASSTTFSARLQFWTSRGFAVLDVNYGGSTGYGRAYRERLKGQWGVVDVEDCARGAKYIAGQGEADPDRLIIRGSSAGGFTTLAALTFREVFKAGASYYGISDLEVLAQDTHKFESRYLDSMVGPYPQARDLYRARSPIHFTQRLNCPMILFQGLEDKVVPPDQSQRMFEAVRAKELPVAYVAYAGEQHGFRKAETIKHALGAELCFYARVFKFSLPEPAEQVEIENLD